MCLQQLTRLCSNAYDWYWSPSRADSPYAKAVSRFAFSILDTLLFEVAPMTLFWKVGKPYVYISRIGACCGFIFSGQSEKMFNAQYERIKGFSCVQIIKIIAVSILFLDVSLLLGTFFTSLYIGSHFPRAFRAK